MDMALTGLRALPYWLAQVAKKLWWLLGLLPAVINLGSTYISGFPQAHIPAFWSVGIVLLGLFMSVFLVHLDLRERLAGYEYHEPQYRMEVLEVSAKICSSDQIHVDCAFRVKRETPWPGELVEISLVGNDPTEGIGAGLISRKEYKPLDWHCFNMLKLPYLIAPAGCDFHLTVHYPVTRPIDLAGRPKWERMAVRLCFLIGYETQPVGYVQKQMLLDIPINLGEVLDDLIDEENEEN